MPRGNSAGTCVALAGCFPALERSTTTVRATNKHRTKTRRIPEMDAIDSWPAVWEKNNTGSVYTNRYWTFAIRGVAPETGRVAKLVVNGDVPRYATTRKYGYSGSNALKPVTASERQGSLRFQRSRSTTGTETITVCGDVQKE